MKIYKVNFRRAERRGQACLDYAEARMKIYKVNFRRAERRGQACLDYAEARMKIYKVNSTTLLSTQKAITLWNK